MRATRQAPPAGSLGRAVLDEILRRRAAGWTDERLAVLCGCTSRTIFRWRTARNGIPAPTAMSLARRLGVEAASA